MAEFQVVTRKRVAFQGRDEEWTNVTWLTTDLAETFDDAAAINSIIQLERAITGQTVTFLGGAIYDPGIAGNEPRWRDDRAEAGLISVSSDNDMYHECAMLFTADLPRGGVLGFGRPRYLRKWMHVCALHGNIVRGDILRGSQAMTQAEMNNYLDAYWRPLLTQEHGGGLVSAPNGDRPIEGSARMTRYLEHRQFHRGT